MTRLADLGPLDRSRPNVFGAITPLARDLTTHLGKGETPVAARVSAMMEAIERASAEDAGQPDCTGSYEALRAKGDAVVDPTCFNLPPNSSYRPDLTLHWTKARRLADDTEVLLPCDLVHCPPTQGVILQADTNGLASGNTLAEAILHGLCELIERDAIGVDLFSRLYGAAQEARPARQIDPDTLPENAKGLLTRITDSGQSIAIFDHTGDIGLPVIAAYLVDPAYPGPAGPRTMSFFGFGCAPTPGKALMRALTEAEQSRVCVLQGARDSFNEVPLKGQPQPGTHPVAFDALTGAPQSDDLLDDLRFVLHRLTQAGFTDVYVSDLTHLRLGMPVVRVRVPGLSVFVVDRSRVGPRDLKWLI